MSNQQIITEQDAKSQTASMAGRETMNQDNAEDEHRIPEQEKNESIQFLRGRSQRSINQWFEMAEHLAQKLDEDISKTDFEDICREGAGIDYVTGTVWVRIVRSKRVQNCRSKILTTAWTTFRPVPRLSDDEFDAMYNENLANADEPVPMTEKQIRSYRRPKTRRKSSKTGKSPFMDRLDFYSRIARLMDLLGDDRMMKSDPRYRKHLERLGDAKTMVGWHLEQITEPLVALLTRSDNHEFLTMADGRPIHNNDLERDLRLSQTELIQTHSSAPMTVARETGSENFEKL
jgi:hypothetical protein